jgi:hypothetical protein
MDEVFSIPVPSQVDCWTFLRNRSFKDDGPTKRDIERALVLGAVSLWNARQRDNVWKSEKEYTALWYADFGKSWCSEYRSSQWPKDYLDGLSDSAQMTGKA